MKPWFPILVPPLAALVQQSASYALVAAECAQQQRLPVHLVTALGLAVALTGAAIAWRQWRAVGVAAPRDSGDAVSRTRFLAIVGVSISGLMALAIAAQWLTTAFISPCVY